MKTYFHVEVDGKLTSVWGGEDSKALLESIEHHLWDCKTVLITPKEMSDEEYEEVMDKLGESL